MIVIAISTVNSRINQINLPEYDSSVSYLIMWQLTKFDSSIEIPCHLDKRSDVTVVSLKNSIGLSESRNAVLNRIDNGFVLISDDDVTFDILELKKARNEAYNIDACFFAVSHLEECTKISKNFRSTVYVHNRFTVASVSSIDICYIAERFMSRHLFDVNFGLGAKFPTGEEYIFLTDLIKKGYQIYNLPFICTRHPQISSGNHFYINMNDIIARSKMFDRVFGFASIFIKVVFLFKKIGILFRNRKTWFFVKHFFR